jgi:hypothetical protein
VGSNPIPLGLPTLPTQSPGVAWAVLIQHYGPAFPVFAHFHYYKATSFPPAAFTAAQWCIDWFTFWRPFWEAAHSTTWFFNQLSLWVWDGTTLHSGSLATILRGALLFADRDNAYCVFIRRWGTDAGRNVYSYYFHPGINSTWASPDFKLTAAGKIAWQDWADTMGAPFVTQGTSWQPCIFTQKSTFELVPFEGWTLHPKLVFKNKIRRPIGFVRSHVLPGFSPPPLG